MSVPIDHDRDRHPRPRRTGGAGAASSARCRSPAQGEVLVKVAAAGVNRPDVMQRKGLYPPPKGATDIPGLEIAGEVVALGAGVTRWKVGDKVMALVVGGGYAEYCLAHESHCLPVPPTLSMVEAAAIPETFFTVWHNTFERGGLKAGETLLVHGGSSGIGTAAIQLATRIRRARDHDRRLGGKMRGLPQARRRSSPLTTRPKTSSPRPRPRPAARAPMLSSTWSEATTSSATTRPPPSKAASCRSPSRARRRRPSISAASCSSACTHTGSTLRARSVADKGAIARAVEQHVLPLIAAGRVKPVIDSTFPLAQAAAAHARMETSAHIGKIVLTV